MTDRRDKLGRRIPQFDRSAAGKKASKTSKEKYGPDHHKRIGIIGARLGTPGYFGKLKAEGKTDELKKLSQAAIAKKREIARTKEISKPIGAQITLRGPKTEGAQITNSQKNRGPRGVSKR